MMLTAWLHSAGSLIRMARRWRGRCVALIAAVALVMVGCAESIRPAQSSFRRGDLHGALVTLERERSSTGRGKDAVIYWLEYGSVLHHVGDFERSNRAFLEAEQKMDALAARPVTSLSEEAASLLSNPSAAAYRGTAYDRIMSPTYRAINALMLGDTETPRQALNEAAYRIDDAIAWQQAEITKERQQNPAAGSQGFALARTMEDGSVQSRLNQAYSDLDRYEAYAEASNPFTELLHAVYLLGVQQDAGDADRARTLLRRVAGMSPGNPHVAADLEAAERAAAGQRLRGVTYVFFATGTAPTRMEERIDLPLFFFNDTVDYFGVALPRLVFNHVYERDLVVGVGDAATSTQLVADMDRIVAADFRDELPVLVQRSLASAAVKAAAAWGINEAVDDDDGWLGLAVRIGLIAYQYAQNTTDLRTWATLPKQFQYARVLTPVDGVINIQRRSGPGVQMRVDPEKVNIVYARSIGPGLPLLVRSVTLD